MSCAEASLLFSATEHHRRISVVRQRNVRSASGWVDRSRIALWRPDERYRLILDVTF